MDISSEKAYRSASELESSAMDEGSQTMGRPRIYPFFDMQIHEAVVINAELKQSARACAQNVKRIKGWRFKTRTLSDGSLLVKRIA